MILVELPYLTTDRAGIGGQIKISPEDFYVDEIPRYEASGEGSHTYLRFQKTGLTTLAAVNRIAQSLGVKARSIGYAGLKDAQAITEQTISIADVSPEKVEQLALPGIQVISVSKHRNKLKIGHLAGNKFVIRIRGVEETAIPQAEAILAQLAERGTPNYFGRQRFGARQNSHRLGLAIMKNDPAEFISELLGRPHPEEMAQAQKARRAFDAGDLAQARDLWPHSLRGEWLILSKLAETGDKQAAMQILDRRLKRLYVSAYQSYLFNQLLAQRLPSLNQIEVGDVAYIHQRGAAFVVKSVEDEQPRVDTFEISPAGPMFGLKYLPAEGKPAEREAAILRQSNVSLSDFHVPGVRLEGDRRPYRIPLTGVKVSWDEGLVLTFTLPPGGYATMVLREIMKND
jgi:tRNA pseudouridine13 synthase